MDLSPPVGRGPRSRSRTCHPHLPAHTDTACRYTHTQVHTDAHMQIHSHRDMHTDTLIHIPMHTNTHGCTHRHTLICTRFKLFCSHLLSTSHRFLGLPGPCSVGGEDSGSSTGAVGQAVLRSNPSYSTEQIGDLGQVTLPPGPASVSLSGK